MGENEESVRTVPLRSTIFVKNIIVRARFIYL